MPDSATVGYWNDLKCRAILPQDLVYIGVRDTEVEEELIMTELQLKNYTVAELRHKGLSVCLAEMSSQLKACDIIYVSFDVDSIDPVETSFGTGTPVADGLHFVEANEILTYFSKDPRLCALEIVEVNPCLDDEKNKMAERTLDLIENIITQLS
jgi:arginase